MEIKIDLNNKEQAAKEVYKIQRAIDDLLSVCNSQKDQLKDNVKKIEELTTTAVGLSDTIKSVHLILGAKKDLFGEDKEMKVLLDTLSTFVLGSGAIKLGVLSNAKDKHNES